MKITDWAVVFVLIVSPFLWLGSLHAENIRETNMLETRYTTALRTAAQDGGSALNLNEPNDTKAGTVRKNGCAPIKTALFPCCCKACTFILG